MCEGFCEGVEKMRLSMKDYEEVFDENGNPKGIELIGGNERWAEIIDESESYSIDYHSDKSIKEIKFRFKKEILDTFVCESCVKIYDEDELKNIKRYCYIVGKLGLPYCKECGDKVLEIEFKEADGKVNED